MKKCLLLFILLILPGNLLAQRYGIKGSWHVTDTLLIKIVIPETTALGISFRAVDSIKIPKVFIDSIYQRNRHLLLVADTNYIKSLGYNNPDTVALILKTYGHRGVSILQLDAVGDSSFVAVWLNARDGVSPYMEWNQYKDASLKGAFRSQMTRKGGGLPTILYFGFEGDSTVIDSLRIRGIGAYTNYLWNRVRTADSNVTTAGYVKRIVSGIIDTMTARYAKNADSLGHTAASGYASKANISDSIKSSLYFRESIPWDKVVMYAKMDNKDSATTWYPDSITYSKTFHDSGTVVPTVRGLLFNAMDFTGSNNVIRRPYDRDFLRNHFTFMTFFKLAATANDKAIVVNLDTATGLRGWALKINSNGADGAQFYVSSGDADIYPIADSAFTNWDNNQWHFICATADSVNSFITIQIDTMYQKRNLTAGYLGTFDMYGGSQANTKFLMGFDFADAQSFNGYIDDWMYFSTALTRSQVEMVRQMMLGTVFGTNDK